MTHDWSLPYGVLGGPLWDCAFFFLFYFHNFALPRTHLARVTEYGVITDRCNWLPQTAAPGSSDKQAPMGVVALRNRNPVRANQGALGGHESQNG